MATLRQQIATNVLTVTRFRELMKSCARTVQRRPELVKKAYEFSQNIMRATAPRRALLVHPSIGNVLADMKMDSVRLRGLPHSVEEHHHDG